MEIRALENQDHDALAHLFDQYRVFYNQESDPEAAKTFVGQRLSRGDSAIFGAFDETELIGFTQLYPSYTSVGLGRIWILNDLYVREDARRRGVATALMDTAREYAEMTDSKRLVLSTEVHNRGAQRLYERLGYRRENEFLFYELALDS